MDDSIQSILDILYGLLQMQGRILGQMEYVQEVVLGPLEPPPPLVALRRGGDGRGGGGGGGTAPSPLTPSHFSDTVGKGKKAPSSASTFAMKATKQHKLFRWNTYVGGVTATTSTPTNTKRNNHNNSSSRSSTGSGSESAIRRKKRQSKRNVSLSAQEEEEKEEKELQKQQKKLSSLPPSSGGAAAALVVREKQEGVGVGKGEEEEEIVRSRAVSAAVFGGSTNGSISSVLPAPPAVAEASFMKSTTMGRSSAVASSSSSSLVFSNNTNTNRAGPVVPAVSSSVVPPKVFWELSGNFSSLLLAQRRLYQRLETLYRTLVRWLSSPLLTPPPPPPVSSSPISTSFSPPPSMLGGVVDVLSSTLFPTPRLVPPLHHHHPLFPGGGEGCSTSTISSSRSSNHTGGGGGNDDYHNNVDAKSRNGKRRRWHSAPQKTDVSFSSSAVAGGGGGAPPTPSFTPPVLKTAHSFIFPSRFSRSLKKTKERGREAEHNPSVTSAEKYSRSSLSRRTSSRGIGSHSSTPSILPFLFSSLPSSPRHKKRCTSDPPLPSTSTVVVAPGTMNNGLTRPSHRHNNPNSDHHHHDNTNSSSSSSKTRKHMEMSATGSRKSNQRNEMKNKAKKETVSSDEMRALHGTPPPSPTVPPRSRTTTTLLPPPLSPVPVVSPGPPSPSVSLVSPSSHSFRIFKKTLRFTNDDAGRSHTIHPHWMNSPSHDHLVQRTSRSEERAGDDDAASMAVNTRLTSYPFFSSSFPSSLSPPSLHGNNNAAWEHPPVQPSPDPKGHFKVITSSSSSSSSSHTSSTSSSFPSLLSSSLLAPPPPSTMVSRSGSRSTGDDGGGDGGGGGARGTAAPTSLPSTTTTISPSGLNTKNPPTPTEPLVNTQITHPARSSLPSVVSRSPSTTNAGTGGRGGVVTGVPTPPHSRILSFFSGSLPMSGRGGGSGGGGPLHKSRKSSGGGGVLPFISFLSGLSGGGGGSTTTVGATAAAVGGTSTSSMESPVRVHPPPPPPSSSSSSSSLLPFSSTCPGGQPWGGLGPIYPAAIPPIVVQPPHASSSSSAGRDGEGGGIVVGSSSPSPPPSTSSSSFCATRSPRRSHGAGGIFSPYGEGKKMVGGGGSGGGGGGEGDDRSSGLAAALVADFFNSEEMHHFILQHVVFVHHFAQHTIPRVVEMARVCTLVYPSPRVLFTLWGAKQRHAQEKNEEHTGEEIGGEGGGGGASPPPLNASHFSTSASSPSAFSKGHNSSGRKKKKKMMNAKGEGKKANGEKEMQEGKAKRTMMGSRRGRHYFSSLCAVFRAIFPSFPFLSCQKESDVAETNNSTLPHDYQYHHHHSFSSPSSRGVEKEERGKTQGNIPDPLSHTPEGSALANTTSPPPPSILHSRHPSSVSVSHLALPPPSLERLPHPMDYSSLISAYRPLFEFLLTLWGESGRPASEESRVFCASLPEGFSDATEGEKMGTALPLFPLVSPHHPPQQKQQEQYRTSPPVPSPSAASCIPLSSHPPPPSSSPIISPSSPPHHRRITLPPSSFPTNMKNSNNMNNNDADGKQWEGFNTLLGLLSTPLPALSRYWYRAQCLVVSKAMDAGEPTELPLLPPPSPSSSPLAQKMVKKKEEKVLEGSPAARRDFPPPPLPPGTRIRTATGTRSRSDVRKHGKSKKSACSSACRHPRHHRTNRKKEAVEEEDCSFSSTASSVSLPPPSPPLSCGIPSPVEALEKGFLSFASQRMRDSYGMMMESLGRQDVEKLNTLWLPTPAPPPPASDPLPRAQGGRDDGGGGSDEVMEKKRSKTLATVKYFSLPPQEGQEMKSTSRTAVGIELGGEELPPSSPLNQRKMMRKEEKEKEEEKKMKKRKRREKKERKRKKQRSVGMVAGTEADDNEVVMVEGGGEGRRRKKKRDEDTPLWILGVPNSFLHPSPTVLSSLFGLSSSYFYDGDGNSNNAGKEEERKKISQEVSGAPCVGVEPNELPASSSSPVTLLCSPRNDGNSSAKQQQPQQDNLRHRHQHNTSKKEKEENEKIEKGTTEEKEGIGRVDDGDESRGGGDGGQGSEEEEQKGKGNKKEPDGRAEGGKNSHILHIGKSNVPFLSSSSLRTPFHPLVIHFVYFIHSLVKMNYLAESTGIELLTYYNLPKVRQHHPPSMRTFPLAVTTSSRGGCAGGGSSTKASPPPPPAMFLPLPHRLPYAELWRQLSTSAERQLLRYGTLGIVPIGTALLSLSTTTPPSGGGSRLLLPTPLRGREREERKKGPQPSSPWASTTTAIPPFSSIRHSFDPSYADDNDYLTLPPLRSSSASPTALRSPGSPTMSKSVVVRVAGREEGRRRQRRREGGADESRGATSLQIPPPPPPPSLPPVFSSSSSPSAYPPPHEEVPHLIFVFTDTLVCARQHWETGALRMDGFLLLQDATVRILPSLLTPVSHRPPPRAAAPAAELEHTDPGRSYLDKKTYGFPSMSYKYESVLFSSSYSNSSSPSLWYFPAHGEDNNEDNDEDGNDESSSSLLQRISSRCSSPASSPNFSTTTSSSSVLPSAVVQVVPSTSTSLSSSSPPPRPQASSSVRGNTLPHPSSLPGFLSAPSRPTYYRAYTHHHHHPPPPPPPPRHAFAVTSGLSGELIFTTETSEECVDWVKFLRSAIRQCAPPTTTSTAAAAAAGGGNSGSTGICDASTEPNAPPAPRVVGKGGPLCGPPPWYAGWQWEGNAAPLSTRPIVLFPPSSRLARQRREDDVLQVLESGNPAEWRQSPPPTPALPR